MGNKENKTSINQWIEGDDLNFNKILDNYFHRMKAFAYQMHQNSEDAEELVMNAFLKLWQNKHRLTTISKPEEYLFGILRREIIAHSRKRTLQLEPIENVTQSLLGTVEHPELNLQDLRAKYLLALNRLTPKQRMVFLLSREQDLTQQEISKKTGLSINTIGNHMNAALKVFREELQEYPKFIIPFILAYYPML